MTKQDAMDELGCDNLSQLADALNLSAGVVDGWPDPLPDHAIRRVESAIYRRIRTVARRQKK